MVKQITEQQIYGKMLGYRNDPVGFAKDVSGLKTAYVWWKMQEMLTAIATHQKVAIRAGHSVSKTFTLGRVVVPWFKTCFQPSTVLTTAPGRDQVEQQLWREIHAGVNGARYPLGGRLTIAKWEVYPDAKTLEALDPESRADWEKNFAIGISVSPDSIGADSATRLQGYHNKWFLALIDEACGILPVIWNTILDKLIINPKCKIVAIGNPTDPESEFAHACFSSDPDKNDGDKPYMSDAGWYVITISAMHTPNYQNNKELIPGLAGREYVDGLKEKYGYESDAFRVRVRGLFPLFKEGTYYGQFLSAARKDGRIGAYPYDESLPVHTFSDFGDMSTATIFMQKIQGRLRLIDEYWDCEGVGAKAWAAALVAKRYVYGQHFAGPDLTRSNAKSFQTGKTTKDILAELGFDVEPVIPANECSFDDGIQAVRVMFNQLEIDEQKCKTFLLATGGYGKKKNIQGSTNLHISYHNEPAKSWNVHMADALRHLGIANRFMQIGDSYHGDLTSYSQLYSGRNKNKPSDPMDYI